MKQEHFKQLAKSFASFGLALQQFDVAVRKVHAAVSVGTKLRKKLLHRRECRTIAWALAYTNDPVTKQILWNRFKRA
jgi:hypothetical protein